MVVTCYVPGSSNSIADALSRSLLQVIWRLAPTAREHPDKVPPIPPVDLSWLSPITPPWRSLLIHSAPMVLGNDVIWRSAMFKVGTRCPQQT